MTNLQLPSTDRRAITKALTSLVWLLSGSQRRAEPNAAAGASAAIDRQLESASISPARNPHIVMGEDDDDDFNLFREILEEAYPQIRLTRFKDGMDAVDYLFTPGRETPALIIMDLNMPRKDGRQAIVEIKGNPALQNVPIVALTTSNSPSDESFVRAFSRTAFVTKPMEYKNFVNLVRALGGKLVIGDEGLA